MKLNNKGITTIEVLICFVLVVTITVSMYSVISSLNEKRMLESYKSEIYTFKNILTKEIQDDFIKIGLAHADYNKTVVDGKATYIVNCQLRDGTSRQLKIEQTLAFSSYHISGSIDKDDDFHIYYGDPTNLIEYSLPDLGESKNQYDHVVKDLSLNNILISINSDNVLSIYIGFYHPELTTRYAINIVAPINFVVS